MLLRLLINLIPPMMPMPKPMPTQYGREVVTTAIPVTTPTPDIDVEMGTVIGHGLAGIIATAAIALILLIFLGLWVTRQSRGGW